MQASKQSRCVYAQQHLLASARINLRSSQQQTKTQQQPTTPMYIL
jgi:hypothetical protein